MFVQLSGKPENVAKKANKDKIIELYNKVFDEGLITSEADRETARYALFPVVFFLPGDEASMQRCKQAL
jgi:hypothetical protein